MRRAPTNRFRLLWPTVLLLSFLSLAPSSAEEEAGPLRRLLDLEHQVQLAADAAFEGSSFDYVRAYVTADERVLLHGIVQAEVHRQAIRDAVERKFGDSGFTVQTHVAVAPLSQEDADLLFRTVLEDPSWPASGLDKTSEVESPTDNPVGVSPVRLFTREPWMLGWVLATNRRLFAEQRFAIDQRRIASDLGVGTPYAALSSVGSANTWFDPAYGSAAVHIFSGARDVIVAVGDAMHSKSIECRAGCDVKQNIHAFRAASTTYVILEDLPEPRSVNFHVGSGIAVNVRTHSGTISLAGTPAFARLTSETGVISVTAPPALTEMDVELSAAPSELVVPNDFVVTPNRASDRSPHPLRLDPGPDWNTRPAEREWFGEIEIRGFRLAKLQIKPLPIDLNSPVAPNWFGPEAFNLTEATGSAVTPPSLDPQYPQGTPESVRIRFSALDRKGFSISKPSRGAVRLSVDGVSQKVTKVRPDPLDLRLLIAFEIPAAGGEAEARVRATAEALLGYLAMESQATVFGMHGAYVVRLSKPSTDRRLTQSLLPLTGAPSSFQHFALDEIVTLLAMAQHQPATERPRAIIYIGSAASRAGEGGELAAADLTPRDELLALAERDTVPLFLIQSDAAPGQLEPDPFWLELAQVSGGDAMLLREDTDPGLLADYVLGQLFSSFVAEFKPMGAAAETGLHTIELSLKKKESLVFYKDVFEVKGAASTQEAARQ